MNDFKFIFQARTMKGTKKQQDWARDIRANAVRAFRLAGQEQGWNDNSPEVKFFSEMLCTFDDPQWWISHRNEKVEWFWTAAK